mmetsp:Transcript_43601/g.108496  ORF Transcript_43601/g.108496 Transcript_43601/m.108496 type:complete len:258 (+) Transcript_43601:375-1148(+)
MCRSATLRFRSRWCRIRSAAFSASMMVGAPVWPPMICGIAEASTTRSDSTPRTLSSESSTARGSLALPILHELVSALAEWMLLRTYCSISSSLLMADPGNISSPRTSSNARALQILRASLTPSRSVARSAVSGADKYSPSTIGFERGLASRKRTRPRDCGRQASNWKVKPGLAALPLATFSSVFIPSGDMAASGKKRSCKSGCVRSARVCKKPPCSQATVVSTPLPLTNQLNRETGLGNEVPPRRISLVRDNGLVAE